jgi:hypothetical protein
MAAGAVHQHPTTNGPSLVDELTSGRPESNHVLPIHISCSEVQVLKILSEGAFELVCAIDYVSNAVLKQLQALALHVWARDACARERTHC